MKTLTYSIKINKSRNCVFNKIMDKSVYADWAKAWGEGLSYEGAWTQGGNIIFFDEQGGTKIVIEEIKQSECIKTRHIAMVNANLDEVELTDDKMQKWIGTHENYYFKKYNENKTELEVEMIVDEAFQEMFDNAWPKALEYFKSICEY